jgi:hypothetical protein
VLAVATLLLVVCRPLAGGWLGLTGGAPETVLVLLDRSPSMEQQPPTAAQNKRQTGLRNVAKAIRDAVGTRSRIVLLESTMANPAVLERPESLLELPSTGDTDAAGDIPLLLQRALDYITDNKTGRTDVWMVSDLQKHDWDRSSPRWETLRKAFATLQGVRFHLLNYPQPPVEDFAIRVQNARILQTASESKLLLDITLDRNSERPEPVEVPVRCTLNGSATTLPLLLKDTHLGVRGWEIPVERTLTRGWGRLELPADSHPANNSFFFVFDQPPTLKSAIVGADAAEAASVVAALSAPADAGRQYATTAVSMERAHEIAWEETGLVVWMGSLPASGTPIHGLLQEHVRRGRSVLCMPPEKPDATEAWGLRWGAWSILPEVQNPEGWRNDTGLLANTLDGNALPVGSLEIRKFCPPLGSGLPLAHMQGRAPLLVRAPDYPGVSFLGTLPGANHSSLSRDGVVLFALLHRALQNGAQSLGFSQNGACGMHALEERPEPWQCIASTAKESPAGRETGLHAGIYESGRYRVALNRPATEDTWETLAPDAVAELFAGLDFRILTDSVEGGRDLTSEIWRIFLIAMACALVGEALLCLPPVPEGTPVRANAG